MNINPDPEVQLIDESPFSHHSNEENEPPSPSSDTFSVTDEDSNEEMSDAAEQGKRPSLKLKFPSKAPASQAGEIQRAPVQTPAPQSATARTPSIKLKFGAPATPHPATEDAPKPKKKKKQPDTIEVTPNSSAKKRKRDSVVGEDDDGGIRPPPKPPTLRKLHIQEHLST